MTFQQSFNSLITKIQNNFTWLKNNKADSTHTHSQYLTSHQDISGKVDKTSIVSTVSSTSTNSQVVGAKLFYDTCGDIETLINNL